MKYVTAVLAAFGLLLLGTALPATADHSGNRNTENLEHVVFDHVSDCGTASVTVTVPEGTPPTWQYGAAVTVDGVAVGSTFQVGPGVNTLDLAFDEDQGDGSVLVEYSLEHATESDLLNGFTGAELEVVTDCEQEPEPVPCEWNAELLADDELCVEPVDEDPKDEDPVVDEDEDTDPVAVPTSVPAGEQLPKTGAGSLALLGLGGLGLLGAGAGLLAWQRRRQLS